MAITLRHRILVWATADGESTSFTVDLYKSPYWIGTQAARRHRWPHPEFFHGAAGSATDHRFSYSR
jgi:hypothetical protein